jgi:CHAT domain-containing protein
MDNNEPEVALDTINSLLFRGAELSKPADPYSNPDIGLIKRDKETWNILGAKYRILRKLFSKTSNIKVVESAANTSELRIAVLERIRINIGEEESRILLGDKYRDSYMDAIECFNLCYKLTEDPLFLEKAFEYTEKSKVANLLASTREMKAIKSHIPENLASNEKLLLQEISFYEAKVSEENNLQNRDIQKIRLWNDYLLIATQRRDSLKKVFERNYPEYYILKYNTRVIKTKDIPNLIGRDKNYISYVISDSLLYIFVVNRKHNQLIVKNIDSLFFRTISEFRKLLSEPRLQFNILDDFSLFQSCGYRMYSYLIEPVKKYLIFRNLIISPDNTLALFPFETLITDAKIRDDLSYKKLPYLMKDYQISYTYSATFLSESEKTKPSFSNTTISFAPSYDSIIYVDSVLVRRQSEKGVLKSLPYAREEAAFVSQLTSGKLYQDGKATESVYKAEAGKFDIIHLAMHTLLNEKDPMNSGMIFSKENNSNEDPYLSTYEIYGISLNAKMVVLSSCYTGAGALSAGEGVLSLARGFIFAGSKSVIMSLWEVDDRSGTDIVKLFYKNLKAGKSKSMSLRKARIKYLENSDDLRSHPYFWSTLIIYGDDSPLYYKLSFKILIVIIPVLLIYIVFLYLRKRRYS